MSKYMYERLSALDNSFLVAETPNAPLHIAAVAIYEAKRLRTDDGGIDVRRIKQFLASRLHEIPRYRQKLIWVPIENRPVWVDDPHFNLDYHVRHTALPRPGGVDELKKLTARITTRQLDRGRPLWEIWLIEGLEGDRFALVSKIHHCMIDGAAGADLAQILNSPSHSEDIGEPRPYMPRPAPTRSELVSDALRRTTRVPFRLLKGLAHLDELPTHWTDEVGTRLRALGDLVGQSLRASSDTPIDGPLGPHRRVDWLTLPLEDVKRVRRTLQCTVNDIVLATVTGAVRHYLLRRGVAVADVDFRVSAPVNMRGDSQQGALGNHVSSWVVGLPVAEDNPLRWVECIHDTTARLKRSNQALGVDTIMKAAEYVPAGLLALGARAASGPINMIVTNVPGPQFPLYVLGARLLEMQPLVPLLEGTGVGIALFSYDGKLHIGINAEHERIPDISTFTALIAQSFLAIADASGARLATAPRATVAADGKQADAAEVPVDDRTLAAESTAKPKKPNGLQGNATSVLGRAEKAAYQRANSS